MNANNTPVIWAVIIAGIVLLLAGFWGVSSINSNLQLATANLPTNEGIANAVIAGVVIPTVPTAQEIADLVPVQEMPDTFYSVMDEKDALAEELAVAHLNDNDFREWLAGELQDECGLDEDFDEDNIQSIEVLDVEVNGYGNERTVTITTRVNVDDDGDDERIKLDIEMHVTNLDRGDDYEDAEVEEDNYSIVDVVKHYDNFCEDWS